MKTEVQKEEKKSIFRKKAMDRITSPEEMDDYLQVTGPGTWFVLLAVVLLVIGFIAWGIMGRLETTVSVAVLSQDKQTICYVPEDNAQAVLNKGEEKDINIGGKTYAIADYEMPPVVVEASTDPAVLIAGSLKAGDIVRPMLVEGELKDGVYTGEILVETVSPISFILN